ncbi:CRISPR-associated helicase/endonuclease Cas3 [Methylovulum psychrotolerans]|uniref:CRISPR-associated nuclease/helicase Cas3 n=1 Tax=Methylovulum psychrotolerans TaxID=1704499 RepID=A0A2S5CIU2_9GAMM|nr:CRISPR-associated helicase/endonuclease Cas3 [Methylovulum psychrotolerans]POZ50716.1 CRISPR-associated nuclease/helicase Cas3 [Methylovulum psychrotolerans]
MFKPQKSQKTIPNQPAALLLDDCLAKTYAQKQPGRKILNHCHIVGEVAKALLGRMPNWLSAELFPPGSELVAACHDLGKVSPTFQEKIYRGTEHYQNNAKPELSAANPETEKLWGGHAGVSQATAEALNVGRYIPEILGQHHGYSPNLVHKAEDAVFGGKAWQARRGELLDGLKHLLNCDFPIVSNDLQAKALAGLTTVSDWIGSGSLFDDPSHDWRPNIQKALDNAGFVRPSLQTDLRFVDLFGFEPRAIQQQLISSGQQPGVYVLEAPMGIGKTEAALYVAYQLMATQQATGLYFALPTQLTSDKIHERVTQFLTKILAADSPHQKALLLHGNAWLKQTELGVEGQPNGSWFEGGKRGILAPFAVGTIDQALMAVMNVKHGFVRAFGLAGKVVILDEVHSYDAYTGTLLDELVTALQGLHCTVIILSATLTQQRRGALLGQTVCSHQYPLISAKAKQGALLELAAPSPTASEVAIQCCQQDDLAIQEALDRAAQGQQVLWIENTVAEAQAIYKQLSAMDMPIACGLLHSRFLKTDRAAKEKLWVDLYGKDNHQARQAQGRILVGTQILEQSLDIDADFLISRFAPTDMLLQRLGRLWRHGDTPRPTTATCEAWLLTPDFDAAVADAKQQFGKTAKVYSPYVLCRSLAVWQQRESVSLPHDIRPLIEATYSEQAEQGPMLAYQAELAKTRAKLKQLALVGLSKAGKTLSENRAGTRYSEQDSVQVLLLKSYRHTADKSATEITLLDGSKRVLPRDLKIRDQTQWRDLAATLLQNTVQVADYLAPQAVAISELAWLKEYFYLGDPAHDESLLRIALVDGADNLKSLSGGQALPNHQLSYNEDFGYQS